MDKDRVLEPEDDEGGDGQVGGEDLVDESLRAAEQNARQVQPRVSSHTQQSNARQGSKLRVTSSHAAGECASAAASAAAAWSAAAA